jgi:hypothetical protein
MNANGPMTRSDRVATLADAWKAWANLEERQPGQ